MRTAFGSGSAAVCLTAIAWSLALASLASAADDAAHALAARFAGQQPAASQQPAEPQALLPATAIQSQKADEAEMLERAKNEAAERAAQKANADRKAQLEREQKAALEADARRKAAEQAAAEAEAARMEAEKEAQLAADAAAKSAQDREREVSALSDRLRRIGEARPASQSWREHLTESGRMGLGRPPEATAPLPEGSAALAPDTLAPAEQNAEPARLSPLPATSVRNATSVTVLLVMEPGTNGIRRGSKTADPVLCLDDWCYVSNGAVTPAKVMTRAEALGPINTLGLRAGACRRQLTCVYRGLDLAAYFKAGTKPGSLQPVDLRYLHHDRRDPLALSLNSKCRTTRDGFNCAMPLKGKGWTAWVVPENIAEAVGQDALEAALARSLTSPGTTTALKTVDR